MKKTITIVILSALFVFAIFPLSAISRKPNLILMDPNSPEPLEAKVRELTIVVNKLRKDVFTLQADNCQHRNNMRLIFEENQKNSRNRPDRLINVPSYESPSRKPTTNLDQNPDSKK